MQIILGRFAQKRVPSVIFWSLKPSSLTFFFDSPKNSCNVLCNCGNWRFALQKNELRFCNTIIFMSEFLLENNKPVNLDLKHFSSGSETITWTFLYTLILEWENPLNPIWICVLLIGNCTSLVINGMRNWWYLCQSKENSDDESRMLWHKEEQVTGQIQVLSNFWFENSNETSPAFSHFRRVMHN